MGKRVYDGKGKKPCLWCFAYGHYQMDPGCPRYGMTPLPLPKSMESLFPVRKMQNPVFCGFYDICLQGWEYEKED